MATPPDKGSQGGIRARFNGAIPTTPSTWLQRRDWAIPVANLM